MNMTGNDNPEEISQATKNLRFKTKKGHCYMLKDRIVITNNRNICLEEAYDISWRSRVELGVLVITAGFCIVRAFFEFFSDGQFAFSALYMTLSVFLGYLIKRHIKNSSVTIILKKDILSAGFYGSRFGRNDSFFEVLHYENAIIRCTQLKLPKKNTSGRSNTQKALEIMHVLLD